MLKQTLFAALGLAAASLASVAQAATFSFTGNFSQDDDIQLFQFSLGAASAVTFRTWSYAGGINAAGQVIPRGGFDPMVAVFGPGGGLIDQNDDGTDIDPNAPVAKDLSGQAFDVLFTLNLGPGIYTGAVMEFPNWAAGPNLSDGFLKDGQGNFTSVFPCQTPNESFHDGLVGDYCERTSFWALDVINVDEASLNGVSVPEPASLALLLVGAAATAARRRRG